MGFHPLSQTCFKDPQSSDTPPNLPRAIHSRALMQEKPHQRKLPVSCDAVGAQDRFYPETGSNKFIERDRYTRRTLSPSKAIERCPSRNKVTSRPYFVL